MSSILVFCGLLLNHVVILIELIQSLQISILLLALNGVRALPRPRGQFRGENLAYDSVSDKFEKNYSNHSHILRFAGKLEPTIIRNSRTSAQRADCQSMLKIGFR